MLFMLNYGSEKYMFKTLGKNIWTLGKYKLLIKFEHAVLVREKKESAPYKKFNGSLMQSSLIHRYLYHCRLR